MSSMHHLARACLVLTLTAAVTMAGEDVPFGHPNFYPSDERPIGWRGDGTGAYPGATVVDRFSDGTVKKVSCADGSVTWRTDKKTLGAAEDNSVAWLERSGKAVVVVPTTRPGGAVALNPADGSVAWTLGKGSTDRFTTPIIDGDRMLLRTKKGTGIFDFTATPPVLVATVITDKPKAIEGACSTPVASEGVGYWGTEGETHAFALADGKVLWRKPQGVSMFASMTLVGGALVGYLSDSTWGLIDAGTGQVLHEQPFPDKAWHNNQLNTSPVVADGRVLLKAKVGMLCYDLRAE